MSFAPSAMSLANCFCSFSCFCISCACTNCFFPSSVVSCWYLRISCSFFILCFSAASTAVFPDTLVLVEDSLFPSTLTFIVLLSSAFILSPNESNSLLRLLTASIDSVSPLMTIWNTFFVVFAISINYQFILS